MPVERRAPPVRVGRANGVTADPADLGQAHCKAAHIAVFEVVAAAPGAGAPRTVFIGLALAGVHRKDQDGNSEEGEFSHGRFLWFVLIAGQKVSGGKRWRQLPPGPRLHAAEADRLVTETNQPITARSFVGCGTHRRTRLV